MKIWILTSKFGQGHLSVAKALEEELISSGHSVIISDVVEVVHPKTYKAIYSVFNNLICRNTCIYNFINEFGRNPKTRKSPCKELINFQNKIKPDLIITTWSACARILGQTNIPVYVCITDLGVHPGWLEKNVTGYLVATSEVRKKLLFMGVPYEKIHIMGIPVKSQFKSEHTKSIFGKRILIMGGGLGILPWINKLLKELKANPDIHITVIAGKNKRMYKQLKHKYPSINVVSYTNTIHEYMSNADLIVSKPGGVSLFESIYSQTPYMAVYPSYKHEIENSVFIAKRDIGKVVWEGQALSDSIVNVLNNEYQLTKYRENILNIKDEICSFNDQINFWSYKNAV